MIDKLEFKLRDRIPVATFLRWVTRIGFHYRQSKMRKNKFYYEVEFPTGGCIQIRYNHTNQQVFGVVSNPSNFPSLKVFLESLDLVFSPERLDKAIVTRMDLCIDLKMPFEVLASRLEVKNSSTQDIYFKSSVMTGMQFGRGSLVIKIYDKAKQLKLPGNRARIEIKFTGGSVPVKNIYELASSLSQGSAQQLYDAFDSIQIYDVDFSYPGKIPNPHEAAGLQKGLKYAGLHRLKKFENANRNFNRSYGHCLTPSLEYPLSQLLRASLERYCATSKGRGFARPMKLDS
jgi:hypothetical protein